MIILSFSANAYIDKQLTLLNCCILEVLFNWFKNNNKLNNLIVYKNNIYQWFNLKVLSKYCRCSWKTMQSNISVLSALGFLKKLKTKDNKLYLTFDFEKYKTALNSEEDLVCKRIIWINKYLEEEKDKKIKIIETYNKSTKENEMNSLLDINVKKNYCKQADAIAKRILTKYATIFQNRIPEEGQESTKTYISICHKIEDIYNGHFLSSRYYNFNDAVFNNKQFDTEGWREKLKAVKGNWCKVKILIFNAVENFVLMHEEDRMPFKKDFLVSNLNNWFYSENPSCRNQSQFIQSLNEPQIQKLKLGLDKAKKIVEHLKKKSPVSYYAGHELNELLPLNASELTAWQFITDIIKWGKLLWQFDENAKYFMQCKINGELQAGPKVLPALFARWLKEKNVSVNLSTLDIKQSSANNGPWRWFYEEACRKHDMNPDFVDCFDTADFYDARKRSGKITFNDMDEIPFVF